MAPILRDWPDIELVCMDLLAPEGKVVVATPDTLPAELIQVERVGGPDDGITDRPRVTVTVYAGTRPRAWEVAGKCRQRILASGGTAVTGQRVTNVLIDLARTATPPRQLPEFGRGARIVQSVYEFHLRRPWP